MTNRLMLADNEAECAVDRAIARLVNPLRTCTAEERDQLRAVVRRLLQRSPTTDPEAAR